MTPTTYLLAAAALAVCWAAACVRRVPSGSWVAVTRDGMVRRVRRSGLAWRLPFVERFEQEVDDRQEVPLHVRAATRDGVRVHVLAEAVVSVPRPVVGAAYVDPWSAAERAAEEAIARSVTDWSAAELTQTAAATTRPLRRQVDAAMDEHGVRVADLALVEVDVPLHGSR
ncbi:SPFH domain-containing protein [Nocardioides sp. YIM 152315]|uniref:SPFH domain-containing protein n=1 Tax=Nocardioides sp. YIM 152315 TaxID=3031760 RepID=UPI0023DA8E3C|nr:SPFH domain-containing protein [Nocardioides sp. YIM 152315]MDF1602160.1 SPFH domain-containing protein [Nocardioides sp. YIM 152315]